MELGMFTCGWQRWPLERAFSGARRLGYDYIELWGGRPHAFAPDLKRGGLREVLALEEKYQMPVAVYTPEHNAYPYNYMLGDRQQWEDCMAYLELCLEMGKALGAEYTLISVGHGGYGASRQALWNRLLESLRRLADAAERLGHKIVLESLTCYESNLCTSAGELAQALDEVGSPALLGMCDVVPPAAAGEPVENYLDLLGDRLAHLHLVDSDGQQRRSHLLPGDGAPAPAGAAEGSGGAGLPGTGHHRAGHRLPGRARAPCPPGPGAGAGHGRRRQICENRARWRGEEAMKDDHQAGRRGRQLHRPVRPDGGRLPRRKPGECCGIHRAAGGLAPPIPAWWGMTNMADSCGRLWRPKGWTYPTCTPSPAPPPCPT